MIIFNLQKRLLLLLSLLGFEVLCYLAVFVLPGPAICVFVARCCVSDHCYLSFDPFFSIVAFLESYMQCTKLRG